jgi:alanyl-tRNA synthetase
MSSSDIRDAFLAFFEARDHVRIATSSLLPHSDPTLLYINSGMAPLKRYFTGEERPPHPDLTNVQPCIRTRDIDDVGDRHHLTFFEMLGSWSINHYFKDRAIELAFELLVDVFGFPREKLYATAFGGDPALGLPADEESVAAWKKVGMPADHIVVLGEDNFWGPAGETGPCGPCTEVFFDTGAEHGPGYVPGGAFDTRSRYIEIWNAGVFMEYDKRADGSFGRLPFRSVDTGSGLERMAMVTNQLDSVYDTDLLAPLMAAIAKQFAARRPPAVATLRRLCDHIRASTFILSEGVVPANEGRGYIPRRLIRKCIALVAREGEPSFDYGRLIDVVVDQFGGFYEHLRANRARIHAIFDGEREEFEAVIARGLKRVDALPMRVSGKEAFALFSTFGMPFELIRDFVSERGGSVDEAAFAAEFQEHQEISRAGRGRGGDTHGPSGAADPASLYARLSGEIPRPEFVGNDASSVTGRLLVMVRDNRRVAEAVAGDEVEMILDRTVAYAEAGGQVGDTGTVTGPEGRSDIVDTYYRGTKLIVHRVRVVSGGFRENEDLRVEIDGTRRQGLRRHHTGTHMLHAALRTVVGPHVKQAGSLVAPDHLRFDFSHGSSVSDSDIARIEDLVNEQAHANLPVGRQVMGLDEALRTGAMALFNEKYDQRVCVVRIGDFSVELCGGTHLDATGQIGLMKVTSEGAVSSGVRRIEAVTGPAALATIAHNEASLRAAADLLKVAPAEVPKRLQKLLDERRDLERQLMEFELRTARARADELVAKATSVNGVAVVTGRFDGLDTDGLRAMADHLRDRLGSGVVGLGSVSDERVMLVVAVTKDLTPKLHAGRIIKPVAEAVGGSGGGRPDLASAGGRNPANLDAALTKVGDEVMRATAR